MAKSGNTKDLTAMHEVLCKVLLEQLKNDPSPQMLNVARQFLRDNGIDGIATEGTPLNMVKEVFPFTVTECEGPQESAG